MSETSSDAESSCGWTIISNEGSDIETLGSEVAVEFGDEPLERPHTVEAELQDAQASTPDGMSVEEAASVDDTLKQQTIDETLLSSEAGDNAGGKEHVLSFSDHSDIVTLGDLKDDEHTEQEVGAVMTEDLYLGTSISSQYTFRPTEPGLLLSYWKLPQSLMTLSCRLRDHLTGGRSFPVLPVQQPAVTNSSSSEDESERSTTMRRRRLRKNTTSLMTEEEKEEEGETLLVSHPRGDEKKEEVREQTHRQGEPAEVKPAAVRKRLHSIFITCILLGLLVAACLTFGHFYSRMFHNDPEDMMFVCEGALSFVDDLSAEDDEFFPCENDDCGIIEPDDEDVHHLREQIEMLKTDHQDLVIKQMQIQAERDDLQTLLRHEVDERMNILSEQQRLSAENQLLKNSLEHEEKSLATLQEELKNLRSQIKELEALGAGADSLLLENQRLKEQLEEEQQRIRNFHGQRENIMVEAQALRKKLEKERKVTDELRRELSHLRSQASGAGKEVRPEAEELQSRLMELEKRLNFEQQRSDLWERLYVETKEGRAKGDTDTKVKKSKPGMTGKMKETFDAVKNSTKEFVHHHKEQIKKAKEAVKENLRKFSDSVKSTFRNFKDSASTFMNKARGLYNKKRDEKSTRESWHHRSHRFHHRHKSDSFQSDHNTRKSGGKVHEDRGHNTHKQGVKGCFGVFDCAYQESMSLFNKAMEPIRADEFHQLLQSYLHQEVDHFHHWKELEAFINSFFHNGLFIHDQMLFTDFVSGVENYLVDMHEYYGLTDDVFGDLDDFIYRHFFGESYAKSYGPSGPFEGPRTDSKEESRAKHQQRKHQRARARAQSERKWSRSGRNTDRHMADVKIELGPMPFDPKY